MNKPKDPRKHGLVKPEKILIEEFIVFNREFLPDNKRPALKLFEAYNDLINKIKDDWEIVGEKIDNYNKKIFITAKKQNVNYEQELADYNLQVANYERDLLTWKQEIEKEKISFENENIDQKIEKCKARLAKLEVMKAEMNKTEERK